MQPKEIACGGLGQIWLTDNSGHLYRKSGTHDAATPEGNRDPDTVDSAG